MLKLIIDTAPIVIFHLNKSQFSKLSNHFCISFCILKEDERDLIGGENWLYSRYNQMCKQMFYERTGSLGVWPVKEMWNFINRPVHD